MGFIHYLAGWPVATYVVVFFLATVLSLSPLTWLVIRFSKRRNKDGSFRIRAAPRNAMEEETDWILPFQTLSNLPKVS